MPSSSSARASSFSTASASSDLNTSTRARDSIGAISSNDGFSVVAPTSTMVPSSITGRKLSCCARLKRWISSTNSSVPCPVSRRARASSNTFLRSATPENIALICTNSRLVSCASSRATVVLPVPGGPQKISEPSDALSSMRVSAPSGPSRWSWPTTSASFCGRSLSASGRGASCRGPPPRTGSGRAALPALLRAEPRRPCLRHPGERGRHPLNTADLLAAALDGDAPEPGAGLGGLFEVARSWRSCAPLTASTMSPRWKPNCCASVPSAMSTTTTPSVDGSSRNSSASAGDRLATLAPRNGERPRSRFRRAAPPARFRARPRPCFPCRRARCRDRPCRRADAS